MRSGLLLGCCCVISLDKISICSGLLLGCCYAQVMLELAGAPELAQGGASWAVNKRQAEALVRAHEALMRVSAHTLCTVHLCSPCSTAHVSGCRLHPSGSAGRAHPVGGCKLQ